MSKLEGDEDAALGKPGDLFNVMPVITELKKYKCSEVLNYNYKAGSFRTLTPPEIWT